MVLALWYSRAAFGRCYSGATCHTAGEKNLKRTSRVFLLGGIILAIIVFVLIILLFSNGTTGTGGTTQPPPVTQLDTVYATVDIPLGTQVTSDMVATHKVDVTTRSATAFANVNDVVGQVIRTQRRCQHGPQCVDVRVERNRRLGHAEPGQGHAGHVGPGRPGDRRRYPDPDRRPRRRRSSASVARRGSTCGTGFRWQRRPETGSSRRCRPGWLELKMIVQNQPGRRDALPAAAGRRGARGASPGTATGHRPSTASRRS